MSRKKIELLVVALAIVLIGLSRHYQWISLVGIPFFELDNELLWHSNFLMAGVGLWVLFSVYWEVAARNGSKAERSESGFSRTIHVLLVNLALLFIAAPIYGLDRMLPASPVLMSAGLAVEAAGVALAVWARRHLGRHWSGVITIKVGHELIRTGPYRLLRHPIYTGLLVMYAGLLLVTGEWLGLIGLVLAALAYWRKIRLEERNLNVAFGADYDAYRRDTWALVPGLY
jgi:protein-S-isoprenylcysteine O-methyltransferase Ste14